MGRPKIPNPTNHMLRIRTHLSMVERIAVVAKENGRTVASESLYAIRKHVEAEEKRLGLTPEKEAALAQLNEAQPTYASRQKKQA